MSRGLVLSVADISIANLWLSTASRWPVATRFLSHCISFSLPPLSGRPLERVVSPTRSSASFEVKGVLPPSSRVAFSVPSIAVACVRQGAHSTYHHQLVYIPVAVTTGQSSVDQCTHSVTLCIYCHSPPHNLFTMKFFILAAILSVAAAIPYDGHGLAHGPVYHQPTTVLTTHAQTLYAPLTQTKYGSQVNHIVPVPAPIIKGVPQPYAVPVPQPYSVPRPVPVAVPRPVPVAVPRAVPVPLVAQAAPLVTKSVVHAAPIISHGSYGHGSELGYGGLALGHGAGYAGDLGHGGYY